MLGIWDITGMNVVFCSHFQSIIRFLCIISLSASVDRFLSFILYLFNQLKSMISYFKLYRFYCSLLQSECCSSVVALSLPTLSFSMILIWQQEIIWSHMVCFNPHIWEFLNFKSMFTLKQLLTPSFNNHILRVTHQLNTLWLEITNKVNKLWQKTCCLSSEEGQIYLGTAFLCNTRSP